MSAPSVPGTTVVAPTTGPGLAPASAPPPSSSAPGTPPGRPGRKRLYFAVVVAVAIAVLLVLVLVVPTFTGSGSGTAAAVLTYSGARPVADRTVSGFQGGGWTLLFAAGLVSATTEPVPANTTALGNTTGCTYTLVANIVGLSLPGYTGNRSTGTSPAWEFAYRNSTNTIAVVSVINGQGSVLATLSGIECSFYAQLFTPIPGNVIDSSQAAAAVRPDAATFLEEYPNASAEFGLVGGLSFLGHTVPAEWSVIYNTCALSSTATGTGFQFNATVNALTGQVLGMNTSSGVSCGGGLTITASSVPGTPSPGSGSSSGVRARPSDAS